MINKELNNKRKQNILNLLKKCKETDKNFKQFTSESHKNTSKRIFNY